jgi:hypothetical protein
MCIKKESIDEIAFQILESFLHDADDALFDRMVDYNHKTQYTVEELRPVLFEQAKNMGDDFIKKILGIRIQKGNKNE